MSSEITTLADGRLFVLSNSYELDGRASTHPVDARGYAPMHCYLLKERERALLVGTGLTIHERQLLAQIETVLGSARLSLIPLALDFMRLSNARPIADRFGFEFVYQPQFSNAPSFWLNFRPEFPDDESDGLRAARAGELSTGVPITLDSAGERRLELVVPPLRLLPNPWLYDPATRTMFTVDVFTWVWRSEDRGPWVLTDDDDDPTTAETVERALLHNRFWWLAGADTARLRRALAAVFERYEIENIAPDYGCALAGAGIVRRHYQLLDDVLAAVARQRPFGVDVSKWTFAGAR
jgi:hypothetical protein